MRAKCCPPIAQCWMPPLPFFLTSVSKAAWRAASAASTVRSSGGAPEQAGRREAVSNKASTIPRHAHSLEEALDLFGQRSKQGVLCFLVNTAG